MVVDGEEAGTVAEEDVDVAGESGGEWGCSRGGNWFVSEIEVKVEV